MRLPRRPAPRVARRSATLVGLGLLAVLMVLSIGTPASARSRGHHHRRHAIRHRRWPHRRAWVPHTGGCPNTLTPARRAPSYVIRTAVLCLLNRDRHARGLPRLIESSALDDSAQHWATYLVATHQFTHGTNFAGRLSAAGYRWQTAGENIATGYGTARGVVAAWMASPDHCRNILDPSFRNIGVGEAPVYVRGLPGAATWVTDFGRRMSQPPASNRWGPSDGCPY